MFLKKNDFTGTMELLCLILRRDKIILPIFIFFMIILVVGVAASFQNLYPDEAVRQSFYLQMQNNPSIVVILGSVLDPSIGGLTAWRTGIFASLIIGLFSIFLMIRHTRSEERKGRLELLNSTAVGKQAPLTAALITSFGLNLIIAILIGAGLTGIGLDLFSSMILGLSMAAFGCLFSAIAAVAVQLTESSGDARYLMISLLAGFFVIRILGWDDGDYSWISWLSPYGWVHYVQPFAGDELWVLGLFLVFTASLTVLGYYLSSLRDLGAGIISQRMGPARASKNLHNSFALAWRIHRGMLIFWIILFTLMGTMLGFMAQSVTDIITANPQFVILISQLGGNTGVMDSYFAMVLAFLSEIFAIYAILATLKLQSQESKKYSEFILTNSIKRSQWAVSNLIFAVLGPALIITIFALSCGLAYGLSAGNLPDTLFKILGASLVYLPAIWILTSISMLLFGLKPRLTSLSWVALGLFFIIDLLGEIFDFSPWIMNLSPFTQVPKLFAGDTISSSLGFIFILAVVLMLIGLEGYLRRDIFS